MECLPHHPGDVVGVGHQIVMFGAILLIVQTFKSILI
jgi:hypothetical protein